MTREQIDAIERLYIERPTSAYSIPELLAAARRAVELEEALEFLASDGMTLYEDNDGEYCCSVGLAAKERNFYAATPLEAIQAASARIEEPTA